MMPCRILRWIMSVCLHIEIKLFVFNAITGTVMFFLTIEYRYECAVNIEDLVRLSDVMLEHSLGPNGG